MPRHGVPEGGQVTQPDGLNQLQVWLHRCTTLETWQGEETRHAIGCWTLAHMCTRGLALTRRVPPLPNISPLLEQDSHSATAISRGGGPKNRSVRDFTQKQLDNCAKLESRKLEPNGLGIGLWRLALRLLECDEAEERGLRELAVSTMLQAAGIARLFVNKLACMDEDC
eukprot:scaffold96200_cov34-Tisochrysis_lutea.AAC.4